MDIYTVLSSKPHNSHYLNRYITFIKNCQLKNEKYEGYVEKHHICPKSKSLFPQYSSFKKFRWNMAKLTARQHFIAHWMLARVFGGKMWDAFNMMCVCKNENQKRHIIRSGRIYEEVRKNLKVSEETKKKLSIAHKGKKLSKEHIEKVSESNRGKKRSEETCQKISEVGKRCKKEKSILMSRKIWFNNGEISKRLDPEKDDISGWIPGRLKFTRNKREKWKENRKKRRSYDGNKNPAAQKVFAAGSVYNTLNDAAMSNNCTTVTVRNRCKSQKFNDWYYL